MINYDEFSKMDLRVGRFVTVEPVVGSEKLYREVVDFGATIGERQILSGIQKSYSPQDLVGKLGIFIVNLEPRQIMGFESQGMLLAVDGPNRPILLTTMEEIEPGAKVR